MAGRMINGAAALAQLIKPAGETDTPGVHRVLPVVPELSALLPGRGLRRGSTVAVATGRAVPGGGSTSLLLALLAEASRAGSWCAVVGMPALGALAAAESGVVLDRLALVPDPGPDWPTVVAALIDGVDVVAAAVPGSIAPTVAGRLAARARQRGSVLVPLGDWSGADVTLQVTAARWEGLGAGRGRLRRRQVSILAHGRGAAARPKEITLWMPGFTFRPPLPPPRPSGPGPGPGSGPATPGAPGSHPGTPNGFGPSPAGSLSSGPLSSGSLSSGSLSSGPATRSPVAVASVVAVAVLRSARFSLPRVPIAGPRHRRRTGVAVPGVSRAVVAGARARRSARAARPGRDRRRPAPPVV